MCKFTRSLCLLLEAAALNAKPNKTDDNEEGLEYLKFSYKLKNEVQLAISNEMRGLSRRIEHVNANIRE